MQKTVVSLGYEQRTISDFIGLLCDYDIQKVLDIRELPLSRKIGFSKTKLSGELEEAGIEYIHLKEAGNPHRKIKADIETCLALYEVYLKSHLQVLDTVEAELNSGNVAVLCFERNHGHCHRSILLGYLHQRDKSIKIIEV